MKSRITIAAIGAAVALFLLPAAALADVDVQPAKIYLDDLYPGSGKQVWVTMYSNDNYPRTVTASVLVPERAQEGYEPLPYPEWVTCSPSTVAVPVGQAARIKVTIHMPAGSDYTGKRAEVCVAYTLDGESEPTQIQRFLISTRGSVGAAHPGDVEGVGISAQLGEANWVGGFAWCFAITAMALAFGWVLTSRRRSNK